MAMPLQSIQLQANSRHHHGSGNLHGPSTAKYNYVHIQYLAGQHRFQKAISLSLFFFFFFFLPVYILQGWPDS